MPKASLSGEWNKFKGTKMKNYVIATFGTLVAGLATNVCALGPAPAPVVVEQPSSTNPICSNQSAESVAQNLRDQLGVADSEYNKGLTEDLVHINRELVASGLRSCNAAKDGAWAGCTVRCRK